MDWWRSPEIGVPHGISKSSILIGFSIVNHPFEGTPILGNQHITWFLWYGGAFFSMMGQDKAQIAGRWQGGAQIPLRFKLNSERAWRDVPIKIHPPIISLGSNSIYCFEGNAGASGLLVSGLFGTNCGTHLCCFYLRIHEHVQYHVSHVLELAVLDLYWLY